MIPLLFKKHKASTILAADAVLFAVALATVLFLRYGPVEFAYEMHLHARPFGLLLGVWLLAFYISDLYSYPRWSVTVENIKIFLGAIGINFLLSITVFYVFGPFFKLTPKINLVAFTLLFTLLDGALRYLIAQLLANRGHRTQVQFLTTSPLSQVLIDHIHKHPQLGYTTHEAPKKIVVIDNAFLKNDAHTGMLFSLTSTDSEIETLEGFYERIFQRVPLEEIEDDWVVREIQATSGTYPSLKRALDVILSLTIMVCFLPLYSVIALSIAISSPGPIIYKQTRVGKGGRHFELYKFRTMHVDAEKDGARWAEKNDPRVTKIGAFLRHAHLDEIPQLCNIIKGDMSFVGPRPERPEFTETLAPQIPYYRLRETLLPGLTGWAQIKFRYSNTVIEAREKFEYDLYYIKNKHFFLDLGIIAKTTQYVFRGQGLEKKPVHKA